MKTKPITKEKVRRIKLHWTHIVALLVGALLIGSVGVGYFIQKNTFITNWDGKLYEAVRPLHSPLLDFLVNPFNFNFLPFGGKGPVYLYFFSAALLLYLLIFKRSLFVWGIFTLIGGWLLGFVITYFDWQIVFRSRPFLVLPSDVGAAAHDAWYQVSSFPSGHSRDTAIFTTLLANYIPQLSWPAALFAVFVAFSRVYVGAHYPSDAVAGLIIGYVTAKTILIVSREIQIILQKRGTEHEDKPKQKPTDIKTD